MAQANEDPAIEVRRRRWPIALALVAGLIALAVAGAWLARERIAGNVIAGQLKAYGLPATYKIESIGAGRQVLRDVVIGDPSHPDLTIERVETQLVAHFGVPSIGTVAPAISRGRAAIALAPLVSTKSCCAIARGSS